MHSLSANESGRQLRDRSQLRHTDFYGCPITYLAVALPQNYNDAINSDEKVKWTEAMQDDLIP